MPEQEDEHKSSPTLGRRVASRRVLLGLTQSQLAAKAGVAQATVGYIEQDRVEPTIETLKKLAPVLDCSIEWLVSDELIAA